MARRLLTPLLIAVLLILVWVSTILVNKPSESKQSKDRDEWPSSHADVRK